MRRRKPPHCFGQAAQDLADCQAVPVAYADWVRVGAPRPADIAAGACEFAIANTLLIDTFQKDGTTLLDWLVVDEIASLAAKRVVKVFRPFDGLSATKDAIIFKITMRAAKEPKKFIETALLRMHFRQASQVPFAHESATVALRCKDIGDERLSCEVVDARGWHASYPHPVVHTMTRGNVAGQ